MRPPCNPWPVPECFMTKAETGGKTATNSTKPAQKQAKCPPRGAGFKLKGAFQGCLVPTGMLCLHVFWGWGGKQGQRFGRKNVFFPHCPAGFSLFPLLPPQSSIFLLVLPGCGAQKYLWSPPAEGTHSQGPTAQQHPGAVVHRAAEQKGHKATKIIASAVLCLES